MGPCIILHTEEMRRVVQCSANVTKSEVEEPLGRTMLKLGNMLIYECVQIKAALGY